MQEVTEVTAQGTSHLSQKIQIALDAKVYHRAAIQVDLYISVPILEPTVQEKTEIEMQLIQTNDLVVQISPHHHFNAESDFLLVTNSKTSRERVRDIQHFIFDELDMQMDEWNVNLYGGLQYRPESSETPPDYVMEKYRGKTVIFIGNHFEFFTSGKRNTYQMCDPRVLAELCVHGTGCLFIESSDPRTYTDLARALITPIPYRTTDSSDQQVASRNFQSRSDLVESLKQHKIVGGSPEIVLYTIPIEHHWYRPANQAWMQAEAKGLAKYLRQQLPNERFLVTASRHEIAGESQEQHMILQGVPYSKDCVASEIQAKSTGLDSFEAFVISNLLPSSTRVDILWSLPASSAPHSQKAFTAIKISLLLDFNAEIRLFLHQAAWPNAIQIPNSGHTFDQLLVVHLPTLAQFLHHPTARTSQPVSEHILELFTYILASCRAQKKRQLIHMTLMPFAQRRSQLHKALASAIRSILSRKVASNEAFLAEFNKQVKALHSKRNRGGRRDTRKVILQRVSEFVKCSTHAFEQGRLSTKRIVPRTEYCSSEEWDRRWDAMERDKERRIEETRDAWEVLGGLIVEA